MPIKDAAEVTGRGWTVQDGLPPGFFYGGNTNQAHLHLGLGSMGGKLTPPWQVNYLGFRNGSERVVIYDRVNKIDNPGAIATLPAAPGRTAIEVQAEAQWAYNQK